LTPADGLVVRVASADKRKMFQCKKNILAGLMGCLLLVPLAAHSADDASFEDRVGEVVRQLDADVDADPGFPAVLAVLLATEYGTAQQDFQWALGESISWGHIAVLSYVRATTGREFSALVSANAHIETEGYVTQKEMSPDRMLNSLEGLARVVARERNSRVFDRLRSQRRFDALPDLGAGFGLFQEALDFRQIGPAGPSKIHSGPAFLGKADGGK
jgi:hypothetical protein